MSIKNKLDETLDNLDLDSSAQELKDRVISKSLNNLKEKLSGLDIQVERQEKLVEKGELKPHYEGVELADVARTVYRSNIKGRDRADKIDAVVKKDPADTANTPSTIASRANVQAIARSLAGLRSSGNEGKTSFTGPNGVGNVGKVSPTGANGVGNVSNTVGNYYALTTDMTLEEYEKHVNTIFEGEDCGCEHEKAEKTKKEIKARGGPPGYPDKSVKKEDVVHELEDRLVTLGSTDWIVVDQVLREMARELDVAPRTLSRDFKSIHGVFPDKWIKEHLDVEVCGYMPLEEAVRLNKVGKIYEVTFMFRGGTNRLKFFWPHPGDASKEDMQNEIEKFWPKGRLIAFYPTIDNEQQSNYMVMAPPVTENYKFMQPEDWTELSEEVSELIEVICEEEGEPISPVINEDNGYSMFIEDHDTGEERQVFFNEEGLRDWFGKSSSSDGKKGWVNVTTGGTCASDEPGEGTPKCVSSSKRASMSEAERKSASRRKKDADPNQQSKSGGAKPTNVKTDVKEDYKTSKNYKAPKVPKKKEAPDKIAAFSLERPLSRSMKEEAVCPICGFDPCQCLEGGLSEEKDKKSKGSGSKDACYHKVKSRYSVWPSAYASGALVKCRQKGAANWGNSSKKEEVEYVDEACWDSHEQRGMKKKGGKMVPNCVPKGTVVKENVGIGGNRRANNAPVPQKVTADEADKIKDDARKRNEPEEPEVKKTTDYQPVNSKGKKVGGPGRGPGLDTKKANELRAKLGKPPLEENFIDLYDTLMSEGDEMKGLTQKGGHKRSTESGAGLTQKGVDAVNRKTGGNLKTAVTTPPSKLKPGSKAAGRRKSFCARSKSWDGERGKAARRRWNC